VARKQPVNKQIPGIGGVVLTLAKRPVARHAEVTLQHRNQYQHSETPRSTFVFLGHRFEAGQEPLRRSADHFRDVVDLATLGFDIDLPREG
jgi:hypothetical protein